MSKRYVIIGASAAAVGAINKLRQLDPDAQILCISRETELPYNKCLLADFVSGIKTIDQLSILTAAQQAEKKVTLMLDTRVTAINTELKSLTLHYATEIPYDSLLIATGSSPYLPPLPDIDIIEGIFTFHTLHDATSMLAYCQEQSVKKALVIGAGLSGLECADALHAKGIQVTIVEMQKQVLPSMIDQSAAELIQQKLSALKIPLYTNNKVMRLCHLNYQIKGIILEDGRQLTADMVIFATGMRSNSQIAQKAGITCNQGAIVTNDQLMTNMPGIYAAGDVAQVKNQLTSRPIISSTWPDAMMQGMIAAHGMAGVQKSYPGVIMILNSAFFGFKLATTGNLEDTAGEPEMGVDFYKKLHIENSILKGFTLISPQNSEFALLRRALVTGQPLQV